MLKLVNICKQYRTGDLIQNALRNVSFSLRDNEFVAILGQSGSGKTTLLNVIGGLDRYDSGDLIINGVSTKKYTDRDWDSYRNHTVGFVFQSYNLIPHQTVLANVELALTISGISPAERRRRAKEALRKVGLGEQGHKKPNQMSGGQMQRVAIARALVNDPDILLADEPTGALDSDTSIQVMDLLKEVAKDRLVVMVTHNPELAEQYATRTIVLHDGVIMSDSDPLEDGGEAEAEHRNMGKSSMSVLTALSLSFNNLWTKKGRTLLTSFAGSIGIIGIALILSLSNGVNTYIDDIQRDTMSSYPITIQSESIDMSLMSSYPESKQSENEDASSMKDGGVIYADVRLLEMEKQTENLIVTNNLKRFREYLVDEKSPIREFIGQNGVVYTYDTKFSVFSRDGLGKLLNTDDSAEEEGEESAFELSSGMMSSMMSMFGGVSGSGGASNFSVLTPGGGGELISKVTRESYDVVSGRWPEKFDEIVLVLNRAYGIDASVMRQLGLITSSQYKQIRESVENGEKTEVSVDYDSVLGRNFFLVPACNMYEEDESGKFVGAGDEPEDRERLAKGGIPLTVSGIIMPKENSENADIRTAAAYTNALTGYIIEYTNASKAVLAQEANPDINIMTGLEFETASDDERIQDVIDYISGLSDADKASMYAMLLYKYPDKMLDGMGGSMPSFDLSSLLNADALSSAMPQDELTMAMAFDSWIAQTTDTETLARVYDIYTMLSGGDPSSGYEKNLTDMGFYTDGSRFDVYAGSGFNKISGQYGFSRLSSGGTVELLHGSLPSSPNEVLLLAGADGVMDPAMLYSLGVISSDEYYNMYSEPETTDDAQTGPAALTDYARAESAALWLAAPSDYYAKNDGGGFTKLSQSDSSALRAASTELRITGVARPADGGEGNRFLYVDSLESIVRLKIVSSPAVNAQLANTSTDVMTGQPFSELSDEEKARKALELVSDLDMSTKATLYQLILAGELLDGGQGQMDFSSLINTDALSGIDLSSYIGALTGGLGLMGDVKSQAEALDKWLSGDPDREILLSIYDQYLSEKSYEENLKLLGKVDYASPSSISIYADSFEDKEEITRCISEYNDSAADEDKITYTDFVGLLMKSVTTIINVISYVLIAFVAVSLIVSSIMIGIITYISVLERTKEIGILRSIGASKRNIAQVFNAETFIIGLCSGAIGIGITALLLTPINAIIHHLAGISNVNAILPLSGALILIVLSVVLTLIGGLIPSSKAAKKDPVTALRSD